MKCPAQHVNSRVHNAGCTERVHVLAHKDHRSPWQCYSKPKSRYVWVATKVQNHYRAQAAIDCYLVEQRVREQVYCTLVLTTQVASALPPSWPPHQVVGCFPTIQDELLMVSCKQHPCLTSPKQFGASERPSGHLNTRLLQQAPACITYVLGSSEQTSGMLDSSPMGMTTMCYLGVDLGNLSARTFRYVSCTSQCSCSRHMCALHVWCTMQMWQFRVATSIVCCPRMM